MPVYVYFCESCNHEFEEQYKIADRNTPMEHPCPNCGEKTIKQKISCTGRSDPISLGLRKPPQWFQDKLRAIKKHHPKSKFNMPF